MTREDIIKMAREVGIPTGRIGGYDKELKRFVALVAAAVAEPVQEPVAWLDPEENISDEAFTWSQSKHHTVPLYTAPPKKEWVGLTDEERIALWGMRSDGPSNSEIRGFARAIEAKLKEKNDVLR
jgi:hypothetical protein